MKDATKLNVYFNGDKALFLVPLYQRKYAWQRKHCERLFSDLEKIIREGRNSHFFGSIVSVKASEVEDDLLIIDGQQRITTISLLILAGIQAVHDGIMVCEKGEEYLKDTKNKYLVAKYRTGYRQIKLRPIDKDCIAYDSLFKDSDERVSASESGIMQNYQLFYDLIKLSPLTFDDLILAIEKLTVIDIRLDSGDDPQLIFESLNSCGKDLEEADKVRNFLLMSLTSAQQEEYYRKYWSKIEHCTDEEPTMFIRDFLTVNTKIISSITELYFDFKKYFEESGLDRGAVLEDMLRYAVYYRQASKGETPWPEVNRKLRQISNIGSSVCMPFFIQFLDYATAKGLSSSEVYEVFDIVENYWARRIICSYPANAMSKTFALLHSDICRIIDEHAKREIPLASSYAEIMKHVLLKKQGYAAFPTDSELKTCFPTRQIYKIPIDYRYFLFERLENENSKEADDTIVPRMMKNDITIEHIMPQTLTQQWKDALGENWEEIYGKYLHTFANLTLTGYNSQYGNHSFAEKKEGYIDHKGNQVYGFKDSAFRLSNYLKTCDKWTLEEIQAREQILQEKFLSLWPMIASDYVPLQRETESVSFNDDDLELTGRKIVAFTYNGVRHQATVWSSMLEQLCKLLYADNPTGMGYLATKESWLYSKNQDGMARVADNCFVYVANSTNTKKNTIKYIFEQLEINPASLEFELVPLNDKVTEDEQD